MMSVCCFVSQTREESLVYHWALHLHHPKGG